MMMMLLTRLVDNKCMHSDYMVALGTSKEKEGYGYESRQHIRMTKFKMGTRPGHIHRTHLKICTKMEPAKASYSLLLLHMHAQYNRTTSTHASHTHNDKYRKVDMRARSRFNVKHESKFDGQ